MERTRFSWCCPQRIKRLSDPLIQTIDCLILSREMCVWCGRADGVVGVGGCGWVWVGGGAAYESCRATPSSIAGLSSAQRWQLISPVSRSCGSATLHTTVTSGPSPNCHYIITIAQPPRLKCHYTQPPLSNRCRPHHTHVPRLQPKVLPTVLSLQPSPPPPPPALP